jgi:hypothetical protein
MMARLIARGEELAREARARRVATVAEHLAMLFGKGAVEVEDARVLARGRGMARRWLVDPNLRFLSGGLK